MKACVVGYGAMGKIISEMLGDDLFLNVALECENKNFDNVKDKLDVIIDFSSPKNLDMIYDYCMKTKTPVVFATTGYSDSELAKIDELSKSVPVLRSANFSLGVILLNKLVKMATPILEGYDIEVIEAHHNKKVDAPSGTAKMLVKTITDETGYSVKPGRDGYSPRSKTEVGVHAVRGGTIVGEHEVMYCGTDEVITLKHSAHSKKIFATGAIKAARWLVNKPKGFYDMDDVLFGENN
ncbi:MAG: 4-hydroxy-tetrahydrodipicolinate reductase [Acholeplasmatales bacterium]|nr:4-hydroxy-tetrahydrodipicolinate reductase [Acholeplasmatales bacterium]